MALTINQSPKRHLLSCDPIRFDIGTSYITTPGVKAKVVFSFDRDPVEGDEILIDQALITGGELTWFCEVGSDINFEPGQVTEQYIDDEIIPKLLSFSVITQNFNVSRDGLSVVVEAIDYQTTSIGVEDGIQNQGLVNSTDTQPVVPVVIDDYLLRCRVHVETEQDSGVFIPGEWLFFHADEDGDVMLNLGPIVHEQIQGLEEVTGDEAELFAATKSARRVRFEFAEHFGEAPWQSVSRMTSTYTLLKGSLGLDNYSGDFESTYYDGNRFITNKNSGEVSHIDAEQYLSFVCNFPFVSLDSVAVTAKVWYEDGTTSETTLDVIPEPVNGRVYVVPCGFKQRNLTNLEPTKTPYKYSIKAAGGAFTTIVVAEEFVFLIPPVSDYSNFVLFHNAFGLPEVLTFNGGHAIQDAVVRNNAKITRGISDGFRDSDTHSYGISRTPQVELSTGGIESGHHETLRDLSISRKHWIRLFSRSSPEYLPATLLSEGVNTTGFGKNGNHATPSVLLFALNESKGNNPLNTQ